MFRILILLMLVLLCGARVSAQTDEISPLRIYLGTAACEIYQGSGTPSGHATCAFYIDSATGDVWSKNNSGVWKKINTYGTVTSVGLTVPSEFSVSGSPVTTSGTLALSWASPVTVPHGGTGLGTLTTNGVLFGNGTSAAGVTSAGASNSVLAASGGNPFFTPTPTVTSLAATTSLTTPLITTSSGDLTITPVGVLSLNPTGGTVTVPSGKVLATTYASGWSGSGYTLNNDSSFASQSFLEVDRLSVRGIFNVYELLVHQIRATNGSIFVANTGTVKAVTGGIARVSGVRGGDVASGSTITAPAQVHTTGNLVTIGVIFPVAASVSSCGDTAGNTYTQAGSTLTAFGGSDKIALYYAWNITGHAANVVSCALTTPVIYRIFAVEEFSGVQTSSDPFSGFASQATTGVSITSGTVTVTAPSEVIIAVGGGFAEPVIPGAGFTGQSFPIIGDPGYWYFNEYKIVTASEAATATQQSAVVYGIVAASFKAATVASYVIETESSHGFAVNDLIRAQRFTGTSTYQSDMTVTAVADTTHFTATLRSTYSPPQAGMDFVRLGSTSDTSRQGSIYLTADDTNAPYINVLGGVASFTDWGSSAKTRIRMGNLNGSYGYVADTYGLAVGDAANAWIKIDPTNGVRIGHNTTTFAQVTAAGAATFTGSVTVTGGNAAKTDLTNVTGNYATSSSAGGPAISAAITSGWLGDSSNDVTITNLGIDVGNTGAIRGGQSGYNTGTGWFLGYSSGYKFSIGNPSADYLTWDGNNIALVSSSLTINSSGISLLPFSSAGWANTTSYSWSGATRNHGLFGYDAGSGSTMAIDIRSEWTGADGGRFPEVNIGAFNTPTGGGLTQDYVQINLHATLGRVYMYSMINDVNFNLMSLSTTGLELYWPFHQDSGQYIYPGPQTGSGLGSFQTSYYLASHATYGLYTNTGLGTVGSVYIGSGARFSFTGDSDTYMDNDSSNRLRFGAGDVRFFWDGTQLFPENNGTKNLGVTANFRWNTIYLINAPAVESDEREKTGIIDTPYGSDFILNLRPVEFSWKRPEWGKDRYQGFLAQDVAKLAPKFTGIAWGEDGVASGLSYEAFIAPMVKTIQELEARIREIENQLKVIKNPNKH